MIFLISLIIASAFTYFEGNNLRKHPIPYYVGAAVLTLLVTVLDLAGVKYTGFLKDWVMPVLTKGALSGAFFVIIMWGGALPNGSKVLKRIMPIRGQLSIIASILVFSHAVTYRTYIISLFTKPSSLGGIRLAAAVCSTLLILILLPLFITSFKNIRKRMNPKRWKALQRMAYIFYTLILFHILFFTFKYALLGRSGYRLNAVVYTFVFVTYGVCRVLKAVAVKKKKQETLGVNQLKAVAACATAIMVMTVVLFGKDDITPSSVTASVQRAAGQKTEAENTKGSGEKVKSNEDGKETTVFPVGAGTANTGDPADGADKEERSDRGGAEQEGSDREVSDCEEVYDTRISSGLSDREKTQNGLKYKDGDFTGSAFGNSGDITVQISIKDDIITSVLILEQEEDEPYFTDALEVIPAILEANSTKVDTVSGATFSSGGILDAVAAALKSAEK